MMHLCMGRAFAPLTPCSLYSSVPSVGAVKMDSAASAEGSPGDRREMGFVPPAEKSYNCGQFWKKPSLTLTELHVLLVPDSSVLYTGR